MLIEIPGIVSAADAAEFRGALKDAAWGDGRASAGYLSARVKDNEQLADGDALARRFGERILDALDANETFLSAALPFRVTPPQFNRYAGGQSYGAHIDGAVRQLANSLQRVRTDLSATLFLTPPGDYDGGELIIEDAFGPRAVKLPAGHLVLYPGTSVHRVAPVTRGERLAAFFWMQSMVRDAGARAILFDADCSIRELAAAAPGHPALTRLAGVYHNLLRRWAEV